VKPLGIDPIHFGVVMVINMELALPTPPVGPESFVIARHLAHALAEVVAQPLPSSCSMLGLLLMIHIRSAISLWLPRLLMH